MTAPTDGAAQLIHPKPSPGATAVDRTTQEQWWQAYLDRGDDYAPRTRYLDDAGRPIYVNRLILAESPYLIQHAHNPVDWHPWGEQAFEKARREDKPVFLSIGYSTCHWCHVMEEESFDDVEVARYLNEHFVAIKVDRERRPDVDDIYMTAVQLLTGGGGWPMSTWLTADGEPFFGGTYYPRESFLELLQRITQAWAEQRPQITAQAARIAATIRQHTTAAGQAADIGGAEVTRAVDQILARHDDRLGGFSGAPKFPHEPELLFLLDQVLRSGDPAVMTALNTTLDHMARGGIYDQVGGGFHRYATDVNWLVPHFEKMLYNQAHLARAYLEAWTITGDPMHERVARQTLDYVLRDMTSEEGGFYSATDADSEGEEGLFFVWTPEQIRQTLPEQDAELAIELFGLTEAGNFEDRNILTLPQPLPAFAAARNLPFDELLARVDAVRERLYGVREQRPHPLRDDKLVTAWNGMMITALARAAAVLDDERYLGAAERAADFLWQNSRSDDGRLWRAYLGGRASLAGNLEDYAYLAEACLALSEISDDDRWLRRATELTDAMLANFWDDDGGAFFLSVADADGPMLARPKSPEDGAIPSGNSVAVRVLANLAQRTGEDNYRHHAEAALAAFGGRIQQSPPAFSYMLRGAAELLEGTAGPVQYAAHGTVRAAAQVNDNGEFTVTVTTAPGWHINAHEPLDEYLIPTALAPAPESADRYGLDVQYPDAEVVELGFQDTPLAVYQGRVEIQGRLAAVEPRAPAIVNLRLTVQACDDEKCLAPEHPTLNLPWPNTTLEP